MRDIGQGRQSFTGLFLVAHPNMLDPNFRRTVLCISAHDPNEGAIGVIINRPLEKEVGDLVSEAPPEEIAEIPVFSGGPVAKTQLMFAALKWEADGLKVNQNLGMQEAQELLGAKSVQVRAFVGYAGWTGGQLEAEMKQKAWILHQPSRDALKPERLPKLWFDIMRGLGPWYKMLAAAPDDPSLN